MFRLHLESCLLLALVLTTSAPLFPAGASAAEMSVKISTSRDDPDLRFAVTESTDNLVFHVFVDGGKTRGGEFGLAIQGGTFVAFVIDTSRVWATMPMANPYPGTIAQAIAGADCADPPTYFGKLTVTPDEPGGRVVVDVIPSLRANEALVLSCDNEGITELRGYPATVNGGDKNARDHSVRGDIEERDGPDPNVVRNEKAPKTAEDGE